MDVLFTDQHGIDYYAEDVYNALKNVGANECETLFIHSDIMFGTVPKGFKRKEYLSILYSVINDLKVKNIIVPTFTYSFCNQEDFDVNKSVTSMGAFNEYIRKQQDRYRTLDPLLSLSVPVSLKDKFDCISNHSLGEGSGLDIVHKLSDVKFLFMGTHMGECFTYLHYIEKMKEVPYRFDLGFNGKVIDYNQEERNIKQYIHTACFGVKPKNFYDFEEQLISDSKMKKCILADSFLECVDEKVVYKEIVDALERDINTFLEKPFTNADLIKKYTKGIDGERITHC